LAGGFVGELSRELLLWFDLSSPLAGGFVGELSRELLLWFDLSRSSTIFLLFKYSFSEFMGKWDQCVRTMVVQSKKKKKNWYQGWKNIHSYSISPVFFLIE
jgi:hypothetical protein